jgi:hypothetical protein
LTKQLDCSENILVSIVVIVKQLTILTYILCRTWQSLFGRRWCSLCCGSDILLIRSMHIVLRRWSSVCIPASMQQHIFVIFFRIDYSQCPSLYFLNTAALCFGKSPACQTCAPYSRIGLMAEM